MAHYLYIKPKKGTFTKDYDTFGKMDPFLNVTLGTETQKTDVAQNQGKAPVWKKILSFKLTPTQYNSLEGLQVLFEAFDEDVTSNEYIGKVSVKLSQVRLRAGEINTLTLTNAKNQVVGTIDVEFEVKQGPMDASGVKASPQKARQVVGTLVIKPGQGRFETASGVTDHQELYLVFIHGDVAYQSGVGEVLGRKTGFRDIISFQHFDGEDMTVRCFDNDPDRNEMIGEGVINIAQLATKRDRAPVQAQTVTLQNTNRKTVGELQVEVEFVNEVFNNPVKVYAPVGIRRGEYISKKIKYSNPDKFRKNLRVRTENKDLIFVKTEALSLAGGESGEIRFKFFAPQRAQDEKCRIDIIVEDTHVTEESLLFKLKAV